MRSCVCEDIFLEFVEMCLVVFEEAMPLSLLQTLLSLLLLGLSSIFDKGLLLTVLLLRLLGARAEEHSSRRLEGSEKG